MYGQMMFLDKKGAAETGDRIYVGDARAYDEAWLRDTIFDHPELLPISEIDQAFGPLIPLCKELRTDAGPIDAVFINDRGRLTIVECKLWRNPQARREVVAQTLDYVSAVSKWSYADLQRQVSAAVGQKENVPFLLARRHQSKLNEAQFIDSVAKSLREGRFLLLLVGDGIREGVQSLTELVNRSAAKAFELGLVEVALYKFSGGRIAIQPRVVAVTETLVRHVTLFQNAGNDVIAEDQVDMEEMPKASTKGHLRKFWEPLLTMKFDDPEQDPPVWITATNNLSLPMPYHGIRLKAYSTVNGKETGVFLSGTRTENLEPLSVFLAREKNALLRDLPQGTQIDPAECSIYIKTSGAKSEDKRRKWLSETLNAFVNVLRPRMKEWYAESLSH